MRRSKGKRRAPILLFFLCLFLGIFVCRLANIASLQTIFYLLESENTFLFLDNIDVRRQRARRRKNRTADDGRLTVRFDVSGYVRRGGT